MRSFQTLVLLLAVVSTSALTGCQTTAPADAPADGVFIHVKSGTDQAHAVLMALRMAQIMAEDHDVLVYFDVDGVQAVARDGEALEMEPFGSSHDMLTDLAAKGAQLYACPGCMQAAGMEPDDLLPGVEVANKQAFFTFTQGRILTLDY